MNRHLRHFRAAIASFVIAAAASSAAADEGETPRAEPHVWRPSLVAASNPAATDLLARVQAPVFLWVPTPDCPRIDVRVYVLALVPAPASEPAGWELLRSYGRPLPAPVVLDGGRAWAAGPADPDVLSPLFRKLSVPPALEQIRDRRDTVSLGKPGVRIDLERPYPISVDYAGNTFYEPDFDGGPISLSLCLSTNGTPDSAFVVEAELQLAPSGKGHPGEPATNRTLRASFPLRPGEAGFIGAPVGRRVADYYDSFLPDALLDALPESIETRTHVRRSVRFDAEALVEIRLTEPAEWGYHCLPCNERTQSAEAELEPDKAAE